MKHLRDARIEALSLAAVAGLKKAPGIKVLDEGKAVRAVNEGLKRRFQADKEIDAAVRARIASLKRSVPEGSMEWDILYRQYAEELARRR